MRCSRSCRGETEACSRSSCQASYQVYATKGTTSAALQRANRASKPSHSALTRLPRCSLAATHTGVGNPNPPLCYRLRLLWWMLDSRFLCACLRKNATTLTVHPLLRCCKSTRGNMRITAPVAVGAMAAVGEAEDGRRLTAEFFIRFLSGCRGPFPLLSLERAGTSAATLEAPALGAGTGQERRRRLRPRALPV